MIYISYWQKGNKTKISSIQQDYELIKLFCNFHDIKINFICDSKTYNDLNGVIDVEFHITDEYEHMRTTDWPIVKLLNILEFYKKDNFLLHLDFDIFWKHDINNFINWVKNNNINVLYQSIDGNYSEYDRFKENYGYKDCIPYCAGLTLLNNIDYDYVKLKLLEHIKNKPDKKYFWYSMGIEQLSFPSFLSEKYKIFVLDDYIKMNNINNFKKLEPSGIFELFWDGIDKGGGVKDAIRYYHFLGYIKNNNRFHLEIKNFLKLI